MSAVAELVELTRKFVEEHVIPVEREVVVDGRVTDDALRLDLQNKAKAAGVFGPCRTRATAASASTPGVRHRCWRRRARACSARWP